MSDSQLHFRYREKPGFRSATTQPASGNKISSTQHSTHEDLAKYGAPSIRAHFLCGLQQITRARKCIETETETKPLNPQTKLYTVVRADAVPGKLHPIKPETTPSQRRTHQARWKPVRRRTIVASEINSRLRPFLAIPFFSLSRYLTMFWGASPAVQPSYYPQ